MKNFSRSVEEILDFGLYDWVQAVFVVYAIMREFPDRSMNETRRLTLEVVRQLLRDGLVKIGDVGPEGFQEWPGDIDAQLMKASKKWDMIPGLPDLGDVFWLENTSAGDVAARNSAANHIENGG